MGDHEWLNDCEWSQLRKYLEQCYATQAEQRAELGRRKHEIEQLVEHLLVSRRLYQAICDAPDVLSQDVFYEWESGLAGLASFYGDADLYLFPEPPQKERTDG